MTDDSTVTDLRLEPLGATSLRNATVYTVHPSAVPHRKHYGVLREDGSLLESTVDDRHHGEHTFIPPDPTRFDTIDSAPREAIYAGPLYHVYGHFIIESCQRLWWAAEHPDLPIVWTADDKTVPQLTRWELDILEILGVRNEVRIVERPTRFSRLHVPDAGYKYADWSHPRHIAFLAAYDGPPQEAGAKLWLSRDPAHGRGLINRHIVERRLRRLGWTIVTFEQMPVRAQLDALARAEVIAGEEASTFHNLLMLKNIGGKRFHVFRRHGPEHQSFKTIGEAREVDQRFHSCSQDAVLSASGRAVVRLAPNPAQYLSHLGIPIPPGRAPASGPDPGHTIRRLNRLADILGAQSYLQVGGSRSEAFADVRVAARDLVDDEFRFDVRSYRDHGVHCYEVSLEQFLTYFANGRTYDLVMIDTQGDQQDAVDKLRIVIEAAAHDRTVVVLAGVPSPREPLVPTLGDGHTDLIFRAIGNNGDSDTVMWQRRRTALSRRWATVSERWAMAEVRRALAAGHPWRRLRRLDRSLRRLVRRRLARSTKP